MNKILLSSLLSVAALSASAQTVYDAASFSQSDLNGTARYVGMGGALNALGADITTMGTNPAGTALYRKSDVAVSVSDQITSQSAQLGGDKSRMSFDQGGVVFAFPLDDSGHGVQYVNFGVNYNKKRNFFNNAFVPVANLNDTYSQTYQLANLSNLCEELSQGISDFHWGLLPDLTSSSPNHAGILWDDNGKYYGVPATDANYRSKSSGAIHEADVNISANSSDRLYYGLTVGIHDISMTRNTFYEELGIDKSFYDITSWIKTTGSGVDLKFGVIYRPIEESPFRFGISVQTPTWYNITHANGAEVYFNDKYIYSLSTEYDKEYKLSTPWKFNLSLGHTIGSKFAFGAEYEFTDFSSAKYKAAHGDYYDQEYLDDINEYSIKKYLKPQHTLKLGGEYRPTDIISLRLGYNFVSSPYKKEAYKDILYFEDHTETDYTNWGATNRITAGIGARWKGGYLDVAYQCSLLKGDFYAFDESELKPSKITNNRHQVIATLGFRF